MMEYDRFTCSELRDTGLSIWDLWFRISDWLKECYRFYFFDYRLWAISWHWKCRNPQGIRTRPRKAEVLEGCCWVNRRGRRRGRLDPPRTPYPSIGWSFQSAIRNLKSKIERLDPLNLPDRKNSLYIFFIYSPESLQICPKTPAV